MDALGALLGLGLLGAALEGDDKTPPFIREMMKNEGMKASDKSPFGTLPKADPIDGAKKIKAIYDAYVEVGFTDVQAFELVKVVMSSAGIRK